MNNLPKTWTSDVMDKREGAFEIAPNPFFTPPLFDSVVYLRGEIAELEMALHKITRDGDLRNPKSARGSVVEEIGDTLFMLATVIEQTGQRIRSYNYHTGYVEEQLVKPSNRDLLDTTTDAIEAAVDLYCEMDENGEFPAASMASTLLSEIYSNVELLAYWLEIDMAGALNKTIKKIEARCGLE
jgi:NTP pyrophosphatase (non-canonical NTP hydrolase)